MKKSSLFFSALLIATFFAFNVKAQNVIINEFSQGDNTGVGDHDWIELAVTSNSTNIQGVYFTSTSAGTGADAYDGVKVQFSNNAVFSSLAKGSIIVIYKINSVGESDSYLKLKFPSDVTSGNILVIGFDVNAPSATYFAAGSQWPGFKNLAGDNIGLFNSANSGISSVGYGTAGANTTTTTTFTLGRVVLGAVGSGSSAHYTGDLSVTYPYSNSTNWSIVTYNSPNCTPGALNGGPNSTLPVELAAFSASIVNGSSINLTWKTATEVNNYGFDVERSSGNSGWTKIGFVAGSGNSNSPKSYSFTDSPSGGTTFSYRLKQIDVGGSYEYYDPITVNLAVSSDPQLLQNSPNPFNPSTIIKFYIPNTSDVSIKIYDILGREINTLINEQTTAGYHIVYWNGKNSRGENVSSGVYLYRLTAGSFSETKKMNLLK